MTGRWPNCCSRQSAYSFACCWPTRGVAPRALRFDQPQRLAVVAPEHVVDEALALVVGHAADLELAVARLVERPAGLLEQQVDEVVAGLGLGVVVRVRLRASPPSSPRPPRRAAASAPRRARSCRRAAPRASRRARASSLRAAAAARRSALRMRGRPSAARRRRTPAPAPAAPRGRRCARANSTRGTARAPATSASVVRDRAVAVHGAVAERVDDPRLAEHRLARRLLEARLVDQRREVVLVRQLAAPASCL